MKYKAPIGLKGSVFTILKNDGPDLNRLVGSGGEIAPQPLRESTYEH